MKRIWIILLTASLLVFLPAAAEQSSVRPVPAAAKESPPPGMETSPDSAAPVENTARQQANDGEHRKRQQNQLKPGQLNTSPAAGVTTAHAGTDGTAGHLNRPSTAAAAERPQMTEPESQSARSRTGADYCLNHRHRQPRQTRRRSLTAEPPRGSPRPRRLQPTEAPFRHRLLDRLCADRRCSRKGAGPGTIGRGLLGQPHHRKPGLHLPRAGHHRPTEPLRR